MYTRSNGEFALSVEPQNTALQQRMAEVRTLRANDQPTIPTTLGIERATNPFLRPMSKEIAASLGLEGASEVEVFAATRQRKDNF